MREVRSESPADEKVAVRGWEGDSPWRVRFSLCQQREKTYVDETYRDVAKEGEKKKTMELVGVVRREEGLRRASWEHGQVKLGWV